MIPDEFVYAPSPAEWLDAYDKCDYVLTNSYHGTIFAILMKKQFLIVRQKKGKVVINDPRFGSMLKLFGLEDRIFQDGSIEQMCLQINQPVKWDDLYNRLQDQRTISRGFLMTALVK